MTRLTTITVAVLALSASLLAAAEQKANLGAPAPVTPEVEGGLPQYRAEIAYSAAAKVWLVVWEDGRVATDETARDGRAQDIYAARVSLDGKTLDPKGIPICTAKDFQGWPCVASDGADFLVAWHDMRSGKDWDVYAARVSGEGKVQDKDGFLVAGGERNQCLPDLVFGGGSYYAVWMNAKHFPEYRVCGGRVSPAGKPLDGEGTELMRFMTDKEIDLWRKAPFAPGKGGSGWHDFGKRSGHSRQPCRPTLATNGKVHVASTYMSGYGANGSWSWQEYRLRSVDAASGKPTGEMLPLKTGTSVKYAQFGYAWGNLKNRLGLAGTDKGFLIAGYHNKHGFGSDGSGIRVVFFLDAAGAPVTEAMTGDKGKKATLPKVRLLVEETVQRGEGYRTGGVRSNKLALAWDGVRALHVSDRYIQTKSGKAGRYKGDLDVVGIFLDADGQRLSDVAACTSVPPDKREYQRKGKKLTAEPPRITPFLVATGEAVQGAPAVAAGAEGSFLVVWQEQPAKGPSRIMARLVRAR